MQGKGRRVCLGAEFVQFLASLAFLSQSEETVEFNRFFPNRPAEFNRFFQINLVTLSL